MTWRVLVRVVWWLRWRWARLSGRARIAAILIGLIILSSQTQTVAPALSETAHGLAVLIVAGVGLWLILSAPFRRRRF